MRLDHKSFEAQHRGSAVGCDIKLLEHSLERGFDQQCADFRTKRRHQCVFDLVDQRGSQPLIKL